MAKVKAWKNGQAGEPYFPDKFDIKDMLRTIFARDVVQRIDPWRNPKFRRPYHYVMSLMRATSPSLSGISILDEMERLGQSPYYWPAPNGYPDSIGAWGSGVLGRWELAHEFFHQGIPDLSLSSAFLTQLAGGGPAGAAQQINVALTGGTLSNAEVARVQAYIDERPWNAGVARDAFSLLASSPGYQYY